MRALHYFVVFRAGRPRVPWVPKDYAHCLVMWFQPPNWMAAEMVMGAGVTIRAIPPEDGDRFFGKLLDTSTEIIKVKAGQDRMHRFPMMTCVTLTGQIIGHRSPIWLNPKGFRDYLVRHKGGTPMEVIDHGRTSGNFRGEAGGAVEGGTGPAGAAGTRGRERADAGDPGRAPAGNPAPGRGGNVAAVDHR